MTENYSPPSLYKRYLKGVNVISKQRRTDLSLLQSFMNVTQHFHVRNVALLTVWVCFH